MINLFEHYTTDTKDLHQSLKRAGFDFKTIVLNESGFLPKDVMSPYGYFLDFPSDEASTGCYFNEVVVPDFWEIRSSNAFGEIFENHMKRGVIHYVEPTHQRIVDRVDWLDKIGRLMFVEHYNQYGKIFAKTYYNGKDTPIFRTYYNTRNEETIVEHYEIGTIILNFDNKIHVFQSAYEFYLYFFKIAGIPTTQFVLNRLSTPFMLTYQLDKQGRDILFWQESISDTIPGNMRVVLEGDERIKKIFVQNEVAYNKLMTLVKNEEQRQKIALLGTIYHFEDYLSLNKQVLTLTNSDNLERLKELVEALPQVTFHIGAITEMSDKLMMMAGYDNVRLYPNIHLSKVEQLLKTCCVYLDINYENEILNAIRRAFEQQQVILAFEETCHQKKWTTPKHVYSKENYTDMIDHLAQIVENDTAYQKALKCQKKHALHESTTSYQMALESFV